MENIPELIIDQEVMLLSEKLISEGGVPPSSEADAIHIAVSAVHSVDFLLTWNCRHINNVAMKSKIRAICDQAGYACPEICTPMEFLMEDNDVSR